MPRSSGKRVRIDFKHFADDTIIDLVRNPRMFSGIRLVRYKNGKVRIAPELEDRGRIWLPSRDPILETMKLPRRVALGPCPSRDVLMGWIVSFLGEFVDFSSPNDIMIAAHVALSTWFVHRLPIAPLLSISGPTGSGKTLLARCLSYICRRGLLFSDLNATTLLTIPMRFRPTLIMDEVEVTEELGRLLRAGTHRHSPAYRGGRVIDLFCPKIVVTQTPLIDAALINRAVEIRMAPTSRNMPRLTASKINYVESLIVPKVFRYFLENYNHHRSWEPMVNTSSLSPHKRDTALSLAEPYDSAVGQQSIVQLLRPQDESASSERSFTRESAVLMALFATFGDPKRRSVRVGEIATLASLFLRERGERLQLSPKETGLILRRLGFKTEIIGSSGRGLWLTLDLIKMTYNLGRHYGVAAAPEEVLRATQKRNVTDETPLKKPCTTARVPNSAKQKTIARKFKVRA